MLLLQNVLCEIKVIKSSGRSVVFMFRYIITVEILYGAWRVNPHLISAETLCCLGRVLNACRIYEAHRVTGLEDPRKHISKQ